LGRRHGRPWCSRLTEHLHSTRERPLGADAPAHQLGREPQRVDSGRRRISRVQVAHCATALIVNAALDFSGDKLFASTYVKPLRQGIRDAQKLA